MKTPKELVDKFIKSFGDYELPIDEMYYNRSESTGINMRSFLEDFAEDISEQTKELQEQLAAKEVESEDKRLLTFLETLHFHGYLDCDIAKIKTLIEYLE